jgi:hypothetical protein
MNEDEITLLTTLMNSSYIFYKAMLKCEEIKQFLNAQDRAFLEDWISTYDKLQAQLEKLNTKATVH